MAKDPAALFYVDKWIAATQGMRADVKGWYLELILYQFDKGPLPNEGEDLASICRIRPSEYPEFIVAVHGLIKDGKFIQNADGKLENPFAADVIAKRKTFKASRSHAGRLSYLSRFLSDNFKKLSKAAIEHIKASLDPEIDLKDTEALTAHINVLIDQVESKPKKSRAAKRKFTPPTQTEFLEHALVKCREIGLDFEQIKPQIVAKWHSWTDADWHTNQTPPRPINNWKSTLSNTLPHLKNKPSNGHQSRHDNRNQEVLDITRELSQGSEA